MNRKNNFFAVAFFAIVAIVVAISIVAILYPRHEPIILQGTVEVPEVRVAGKLTGRVERICVAEGDDVAVGDTLIIIHSPEMEAQRVQAEALKTSAAAQSRKVEAGTRPEIITSAKQAWKGATAQRKLAQKSYERIVRLWTDSVVSLQRKDEAYALYQSAVAAEQVAKQQYLLAKRGAQSEDRVSAEQIAIAASGTVEAVDAILQDSHLLSPIHGTVAQIYPEVGELVTIGTPLVTIAELTAPYAVFNVREDYMPYFYLDSRFMGAVPALGGEEIEWEVYYISPLGNYATWRTTRQMSGYDMRTFEIHARPTEPICGLLAGMSVIIQISE